MFGSISITWLLKSFDLGRDTIGVQKEAAVWLFNIFLKKAASFVIDAQVSSKRTNKDHVRLPRGRAKHFNTYSQAVNVLLMKYAGDEVIVETRLEMTWFAQSSDMTLFQCAGELGEKTLRCSNDYEKYAPNRKLFGELNVPNLWSMRK